MPHRPSKLSVKPLRKTYQPKYPSYWEENPLDHPNAYPYPFSKKMLYTLGATGFTGALLLSTLSSCDTPQNIRTTSKHEKLINPFPISATNLPYTPVSFGTGLPSRLKREDAIDFINSVFQKEGLAMHYDTVVELNGLFIPTNAYNEEYKLGYVWLDYQNYGEGMAREHDWRLARNASQSKAEKFYQKQIDQQWEWFVKDTATYINNRIPNEIEAALVFQKALTETLPSLATEKEKKQYFINQYIQYYIYGQGQYQEEDPAVEAQVMIQIPERIEEPLAALALMNRFGQSISWYKRPSRVGERFTTTFKQKLEQIRATSDVSMWRKRMEALIEVLNAADHYQFIEESNPVLEAQRQVLERPDWQNRHKYLEKVRRIIDEQLVDFSEMEKMEDLAKKGKNFIAPIGMLDDRTIIKEEWGWTSPSIYPKEIELHKKIKAAKTEEEKKNLKQSLKKLYEEQKILRQERADSLRTPTLQQLEADVRQYIQWAKMQQGY